ncbi:MAG: oligosaccharide flippase family protein [Bacteroidales bacterium]|nr:oligosaccharide flippase family protein [Bacteroidales bacterium]
MILKFSKILLRFRGSTEAKVLSTNFLSLASLRILGYIFPLITVPYLARVIGVDKFGEIAFGVSTIIYLQTIIDFGFNYTAVRDIARIKNDKNKVSEIFSTVMITEIFLMFFSFILLIFCIYTFSFFYKYRLILLLTFLYIPGHILFPAWFFQAMEQMKYITFLNLLSKLIFTLLVFVFIKDKGDYIFQPILTALGFYVSGIISIYIIIKKYNVRIVLPSFSNIKNVLKGSWNMFVILFLPNLYSNFSIILLNSYVGQVATGLYSSGYKFIDLATQLFSVLSRTFYPFLARRIDKHSLYVKISGAISIVAVLCLFFGADLLVKIFYTDEFTDSAKVIRIMALGPLFFFLMNTFGPNYLLLIRKDHLLRNIVFFCSIGGFFLTWILIPRYSYIGAAITITVVWGIRGILTWFYALRYKNT